MWVTFFYVLAEVWDILCMSLHTWNLFLDDVRSRCCRSRILIGVFSSCLWVPLWCHSQQLVEHGYNCQCCPTACLCSAAAWQCPSQRDGQQQHEPFPHGQHPQQQSQVHYHQQGCTSCHHVSPSSNLRSHSWVLILFDHCGDLPPFNLCKMFAPVIISFVCFGWANSSR